MENHRLKACIAGISLVLFALSACSPTGSNGPAQILLFTGYGTSPNDVKAIETILKAHQLAYFKAGSSQLDGLSESQLAAYRLIIVPGGNYITMGNNLTSRATTNIYHAVQGGVNYLGICAGAILAGQTSSNNFNLTSGVRFDFYAEVNRGIHKSAVAIAGVGTPTIEHYWEDGPQFSGWGAVVGKYPDGTPAIAEGTSGKGFVILCGVHPEAPENWRSGMTFTTSASVANDYAGTLIEAALKGTWLPHY